jgi:hypothetical protein
MNIVYLTFGDNIKYHLQAYFSIRSIQRYITEEDKILVLSTNPSFYKRCDINVIPLSEELVKSWEGDFSYPFRIKVKGLEYIQQQYPDDHILFVDTDTFAYNSLDDIRKALSAGDGVMFTCEGHPSTKKFGPLKMWKMVENKCYSGITINKKHDVWNSGVIGLPASKAKEHIQLSLEILDAMLNDNVTYFTVEQYAQSIAMEERMKIHPSSHIFGHYWGNKEDWEEFITNFLLESYMTNRSIEEEIQAISQLDFSQIPIFKHHSNTYNRLNKLIRKCFPDREYISIEKTSEQ